MMFFSLFKHELKLLLLSKKNLLFLLFLIIFILVYTIVLLPNKESVPGIAYSEEDKELYNNLTEQSSHINFQLYYVTKGVEHEAYTDRGLRLNELRMEMHRLGNPYIPANLVIPTLIGCQQQKTEETSIYKENYEIIGSAKQEILGEVSESIYFTSDRENLNAPEVSHEVTREGLEFSVPIDGRYEIFAGPQGNISVFDEHGHLLLKEVVGYLVGGNSITMDLKNTYKIYVDGGYDGVYVTPVNTELKTNLTKGIWDVGLDIEPGIYSVKLTDQGFGYLQIFEKNQSPRVFEFISIDSISTESTIELKDGQKLKVSQTPSLEFIPENEK